MRIVLSHPKFASSACNILKRMSMKNIVFSQKTSTINLKKQNSEIVLTFPKKTLMRLEKLQKLIAKGESEDLEFKKTTGQRTEAAKTVCALLNGLGGFVIFGVSDKGETIGQQVTAKTLEDIALELRRIEPPAFPEIETVNIGND